MSKDQARVVVVTGAGRGMGKATADAFAETGARVAYLDRTEKALRAAEEHDGCVGIICDVTDESAVGNAFEQIIDKFGTVDVLANFAGSTVKTPSPSHLTARDDWMSMIDSNLTGTFLCCKAAINVMLDNGGGRIINISSNAGRTSSPVLGVAYTASKAGVIGLTRHLALEYAGKKILVNTIAPGPADTPRLAELLKPEQIAGLASRIPLGRLTDPKDVAELALFLASDKASFITGATIDVNGGFVMV